MTCKNCTKKNDEDSKFCEFCGEKLELEKTVISIDDTNKPFIDHLEFLGYEIESDDDKKLFTQFIARHPSRSNLVINSVKGYGTSFVSIYTLNNEKVEDKKSGLLEVINEMNNNSLLCTFSISESNSILCSGLYLGKYSKKEFADFLEIHEGDIQREIRGNDKLLKFT